MHRGACMGAVWRCSEAAALPVREARPTARPGTGLVPVTQLASPGPVAVLIQGL